MRVVSAAAAAVLAAGACTPATPLPGGPAQVRVTMDEFRFRHEPSLPAGRVVVRTQNVGRIGHEVVVVRLPEDLPPLLEQLRSDTRRATSTLFILPVQEPGERGIFALDLAPGRYGLVCFVNQPGGRPHALRGMASEFTVSDVSARDI